jgi:hypothetical protein
MQTRFSDIRKFVRLKNKQALKNSLTLSDRKTSWLIVGTFAVVMALEYATPSAYVFGYLYTAPILLANPRLNRSATLQVTLAAAVLTLSKMVFPSVEFTNSATVANRYVLDKIAPLV